MRQLPLAGCVQNRSFSVEAWPASSGVSVRELCQGHLGRELSLERPQADRVVLVFSRQPSRARAVGDMLWRSSHRAAARPANDARTKFACIPRNCSFDSVMNTAGDIPDVLIGFIIRFDTLSRRLFRRCFS